MSSSFLSDTGAQDDDAQEHDTEGNALATTSSQIASVASMFNYYQHRSQQLGPILK